MTNNTTATSLTSAQEETELKLDDIAFIRYTPPNEIPKTELFGYDSQKKAAISLALDVSRGGEKRVFVFGLPGSGAGNFPYAVLWELKNYNVHFSLIHLICENIILVNNRKKVIKTLEEELEKRLLTDAKKREPIALFIERPEALSQKFQNFHGNKAMVTSWLSSFLSRKFDKTLLLSTSDDPSNVDLSLIKLFDIPIYLRILSLEAIQSIFKAYLKRPDYLKIAEEFHKKMKRFEFRFVSAEIVKASQEVTHEKGYDDLTARQVAERIKSHIFPCYHSKFVESYEKRNEVLMDPSHIRVLNDWAQKLG